MTTIIAALGHLLWISAWVFGIAAASGFWSTLFAVIFPPWGWIVLAGKALAAWGWA